MKNRLIQTLVVSLVISAALSPPKNASAGVIIGGASALLTLKVGMDPRGAGDGAQAFLLFGGFGTLVGASLIFAGAMDVTGTGFDTLLIVLSENAAKNPNDRENQDAFTSILKARYPELEGGEAIPSLAKAMMEHWKKDPVSMGNGATYVSIPEVETLSILEPTGLLEADPAFAYRIASELQ